MLHNCLRWKLTGLRGARSVEVLPKAGGHDSSNSYRNNLYIGVSPSTSTGSWAVNHNKSATNFMKKSHSQKSMNSTHTGFGKLASTLQVLRCSFRSQFTFLTFNFIHDRCRRSNYWEDPIIEFTTVFSNLHVDCRNTYQIESNVIVFVFNFLKNYHRQFHGVAAPAPADRHSTSTNGQTSRTTCATRWGWFSVGHERFRASFVHLNPNFDFWLQSIKLSKVPIANWLHPWLQSIKLSKVPTANFVISYFCFLIFQIGPYFVWEKASRNPRSRSSLHLKAESVH